MSTLRIPSKGLRFGVLFSGGTAAGMNVTLEHLFRHCQAKGATLIGFRFGWEGLYKNDFVVIDKDFIHSIGLKSGGSSLGSCSKVNVFNHDGKDYSNICHATYLALRLNGIFVLGGDGTMRQANELSEKFSEMNFFWLSATLDRDVANCDDTIGFHTAVEQAAEVIANMANDGATMRRSTIVECMGRHSGWVTLYAVDRALRKYGGNNKIKIDMVLIPEIKFNLQGICDRVSTAIDPITIIISEGIPLEDKASPEQEGIVGHHKSLAKTCEKLAAILQSHSNFPFRTQIVGYQQRTGTLSSADEFLALNCAKLAVEEAVSQSQSMAIIFVDSAFKSIPMADLVAKNQNAQESKVKKLIDDPVVEVLQDQLSAGAFRPV